MPFLDWLLMQQERTDDVGRLARDIEGERKRIGKPLRMLNNRADLMWHCIHAPKETCLSRAIGLVAWNEWIASQNKQAPGDSQ
jgi:hypothetical protein